MPKLKPCCVLALGLIAGGGLLLYNNKGVLATPKQNRIIGNGAILVGVAMIVYNFSTKKANG